MKADHSIYTQTKKRAGFIMVELVAVVFLVGLMLTVLAVSLDGYASFNNYLLTRQRCTAAAEAQLDSIAITGSAISDKDIQRLWPNLKISVERTAGTDQWRGLKLIKVAAEAKSRRKMVHIELSRYILAAQERQ